MNRGLDLKIKEKLAGIAIILVIITFILIINLFYKYVNNNNFHMLQSINNLAYNTSDFVYLSDLPYMDSSFVEPGYYIRLDKSGSSGLLTLNVKDSEDNVAPKAFIKGISAWATSELVYDLRGTNYDKFTSYLGVNASEVSTYYNSGVTFYIYTSLDGENWQEAFKTPILKGWDPAVYAEVNIKEANYLKLRAYENGDSWYSQWYDDALYANAKLVKDGYVEKNEVNQLVKPLSYYDEILKNKDNGVVDSNIDYDLILLEREFVSRVGYDILQAYLQYSSEYETIIRWLFENKNVLETYLLGGTPDGNYGTSLQLLNSLYQKYNADLNDPEYSDLYLKMMISLSLTHSQSVGLWVSGAPEDPDDPNGSNALERYQIFKTLHKDGLLDNNIYEDLSVEEMRFVMNNIIDDEEIKWLNDLVRKEGSRDPYHYIVYRFGYDYSKPMYYDLNRVNEWNNKVRSDQNNKFKTPYNFLNYDITYGSSNHPKLWIVFEEGSVCGGLSKTGSNINGSFGVPSTVVSQPGHAAYIYMAKDTNGNKVWNLYNDVSGWGQSGKTEKLSTRMPNGWGTGDYVGSYPASYIILAQVALSDYQNYVKSEEILMQAPLYTNDYQKLATIYEEALTYQKVNFDAWLGLVENTINNPASTQNDYLKLIERITTDLRYYPLPMHDLIRMMENKLTPVNHIAYQNYLQTALKAASVATENDTLQPNVAKQVANYLLNSHDTTIATFSFDGEDANTIKLADRYEGNDVKWQYSIDSAESWTDVNSLKATLNNSEIATISDEEDILVRIVGALEVIYNIDITKSMISPNVYNNDLENRIIGVDNTMEWRYEDSDIWTKFSEEEPNLKGNVNVYVRVGANGTKLPSDEVLFEFTDNGEEATRHYIPLSRMHITSVSSEEPNHNNGVNNLLDGNINNHWHTLWDGSDTAKFVTIGLDRGAYIKAIDYVPRNASSNGNILKIRVSFKDEEGNYQVVYESTDENKWANNNFTKTIELDQPIYATEIKIEGIETYGNYMSATAFHLYEDMTLLPLPALDIKYSHTLLTNQDVIATVILEDDTKDINEEITITNALESDLEPYSHVFTENGEYTFMFVDKNGNSGSITARVDWIDKTLPTAEILYSTMRKTSEDVVVQLVNPSKEITILNNNGSDTYTFTENGEFTFEYQDKYGNINTTTAKVTWIDKSIVTPTEDKKDTPQEEENNNANVNDNSNVNDNEVTNNSSNSSVDSSNSNSTPNNKTNNNSSNNNQSNSNDESNNKVTNDSTITDKNDNDINNNDDGNDNIENNNQTNSDLNNNYNEQTEGVSLKTIILIIVGSLAVVTGGIALYLHVKSKKDVDYFNY